MIALNACASVAAPASEPASAAATLPVDCLDVQGQRELLAGIELELGPQAAQLARCNARVSGADRYAAAQAQRADAANTRTAVVAVVVAVLATGVAALASWGITHAVDTATAQSVKP